MPVDADTDQRLKEPVAKIAIEQNPQHFSVLVEELNRLLDRDPSIQLRPRAAP